MTSKLDIFHNNIINNDKELDIAEYISLYHEHFEHSRFASFINKFLELATTTGFIIPVSELKNYGVLKPHDNINSATIERLKTKYHLEEGIHFIIKPDEEPEECMLTQEGFKLCLMTMETKIYIDYFIFIQSCIFGFMNYQDTFRKNK